MGQISAFLALGFSILSAPAGLDEFILAGHDKHINSVVFSPDGRRIATASDDKTVKIWESLTGKVVFTFKGHSSKITHAVFSPDGKWVASASSFPETEAKVWNADTGKEIFSLRGHTRAVQNIAFSPDGKRLATGSADNTVKIWDIETGKVLLSLKAHARSVWRVAFSPNGKQLATSSRDSTAKLWDLDTGKELFTLRLQGGEKPVALAYSPDGKHVVTGNCDGSDGSERGEVKIWDSQTGKEIRSFKEPDSPLVNAVAFSPDGQILANSFNPSKAIPAPGMDYWLVRITDAKTGQHLATLSDHKEPVLYSSSSNVSIAFSPDGKWLATATEARHEDNLRLYIVRVRRLAKVLPEKKDQR